MTAPKDYSDLARAEAQKIAAGLQGNAIVIVLISEDIGDSLLMTVGINGDSKVAPADLLDLAARRVATGEDEKPVSPAH